MNNLNFALMIRSFSLSCLTVFFLLFSFILNAQETQETQETQEKKVSELSFKNKGLELIEIDSNIYKNVKVLDLSGNKITFLPKNIQSLKSLEEIYLNADTSLNMDQAFEVLKTLPNLKKVHLDYIPNITLPKSIIDLKQLELLTLRGDSLQEIPNEVLTLKKLKVLDLGENKINIIPSKIKDLQNLEELYLDHDKISNLSELKKLSYLPGLKMLHLEYNLLKMDNMRIPDLPSLKYFTMSTDKEEVPVITIDNIIGKRVFKIGGNP